MKEVMDIVLSGRSVVKVGVDVGIIGVHVGKTESDVGIIGVDVGKRRMTTLNQVTRFFTEKAASKANSPT